MRKFLILSILTSLVLVSCSHSKRYNEAYGINISGNKYIKLFGRRELMVHSPGDLFSKKTYLDSVEIPVLSFQDGIINGREISVGKGYYNFLGSLKIENGNLKVDLLIDNTDDKKIYPFSWNGYYKLIVK